MNDRNLNQRRSLETRFRATRTEEENGEYCIEGYFAVFDSIYELWPGATESVARGAFTDSLGGDVRALVDHKTHLVLGRSKAGTLELTEDDKGLFGRIKINENDVDAMNLYHRVKRGDVDQCSFGFDIEDEEILHGENGSVHWTLRKVLLLEVSVVTFPAYEETGVSARKRDFEDMQKRKAEAWRESMRKRLKEDK